MPPLATARAASPLALAVVIAIATCLPARVEACTPSASGAHRYEVAPVGLVRGICRRRICRCDVTVYANSCEPSSEVGRIRVDCHLTSRLAITDDGTLISVITPRARARSRPIVRVIRVREQTHIARVRDLRIDDLPGTSALRGVVHVDFDSAALLLTDARGSEARVPFSAFIAR